MGHILRRSPKIELPNGVAERREQQRVAELIPLAIEEETKAKQAFAIFLQEHNVFFEVHIDTRETREGKRNIGHGLTFISRLRLPEEEQKVQ